MRNDNSTHVLIVYISVYSRYVPTVSLHSGYSLRYREGSNNMEMSLSRVQQTRYRVRYLRLVSADILAYYEYCMDA